MDFNLQDKFCDAEDLRNPRERFCIPDELITLFGTLSNINYATLKSNFPKSNKLEDYVDVEEILLNDTNNEPDIEQVNINHIKIKILSLIQIMHYNINHGRKKTPLHMMNVSAIYEKCKSRELITAFNRAGLCVSYKEIQKHRNNFAKLAILNSKSNGVPIPSHFVPNEFTSGALDNFDHSDKNSLSGLFSSHDTAILCQTKPRENTTKPSKGEV